MDTVSLLRKKKNRHLPSWKQRAVRLRKKIIRLIEGYEFVNGKGSASALQSETINQQRAFDPKITCLACLQDKAPAECKMSDRNSLPIGFVCSSCLRRDNYERAKENSRDYYSRRLLATPLWADFEKIEMIYEEARRLTIETGIPHEVDHILPLKSDFICGLHLSVNLQIIPAIENRRKGNRFPYE